MDQFTKDVCQPCLAVNREVKSEQCYQSLLDYYQLTRETNRQLDLGLDVVFIVIAITILTLMTLMGFFLLRNKNLQMHPYALYGYEILASVYFFWTWYVWYYQTAIAKLFVKTHSYFFDPQTMNRTTFRLNVFFQLQNKFLEQQFYGLYPLLNCLLFVDLWWITKNPFYPQRKRSLHYLIPVMIMFVLSIVEFIVTIYTDQVLMYRRLRAIKSIINTVFSMISLLLTFWIIILMRR